MAFKKNKSRKHKKKQGSGPGDKKHKSGQNQQISQQTAGNKPTALSIPSTPIIASANILPSQFVQPAQRGNTNEEQNIKCVAVPAGINYHTSALTILELEEGYILVLLEELSEGDLDVEEGAEDLPETKVRMMLIVWMLHP